MNSRRRRQELLFYAVINISAIGVALLLAELFVTLAGWAPVVHRVNFGWRSPFRLSANPVLGYEFKPNFRDPEADGSNQFYSYINAGGFRDLERRQTKAPGTKRIIMLGDSVKGYNEVENAFGVLTNLPVVWLALAAPLAWRGRLENWRSSLHWVGVGLVLLFGTGALTLCLHNSMNLRYEVEYATPLVWLGVMGILGLERALADLPVWRRAARCGWGLLLVFSVAFNLLARFQLHAETCCVLGFNVLQSGQTDKAVTLFRKALELQPDDAQARYYLGKALIRQGKYKEAITHFAEAVRIYSGCAPAHYDWGNALELQGRPDEAIVHYAEAVKLQPDYAQAHYNWGNVLVLQGKLVEAQTHFLEALRLKPEFVDAHNNLGNLLVIRGKLDEAMPHYFEALKINPGHAEGHYYLAGALARQNKLSDAATHYYAALKSRPDYAAAANDLAWILATETNNVIRDVDEAIRLAVRACELTANQIAGYLDTLGVAYSEAGRFKEAVEVTERAVARAQACGDIKMAERIASRLERYRAGRAYHDVSTYIP